MKSKQANLIKMVKKLNLLKEMYNWPTDMQKCYPCSSGNYK